MALTIYGRGHVYIYGERSAAKISMNSHVAERVMPPTLLPLVKYILIPGSILLVTWPTLVWYQARMSDGSDNSWGLYSLGIALLISLFKINDVPAGTHKNKWGFNFTVVNGLLLAYVIATLSSVLPMIQAVIAALLYASVLCQFSSRTRLNPGIFGLMILSLPLFASLDFYGGYPLRYFIGLVSSFILNLQGVGVKLEGVTLLYVGQIILIDGPCSGIKMMWTGSLLVFSIVAYFELKVRQSLVLGLIAFTAIICANIIRICALFYIESGQFGQLSWMHDYVGLSCYFAAIVVIFYFGLKQVNKIDRNKIDRSKIYEN